MQDLAELAAECVLVHGYFHNDLHPGNVRVLRGATIASFIFALAGACAPSPTRRRDSHHAEYTSEEGIYGVGICHGPSVKYDVGTANH